MDYMYYCLFTFILTACQKVVARGPLIRTEQGSILGFRTTKSLQFLGIPYASPPIGALRWQEPIAPPSWRPLIYNATTRMPACPQKDCTKFLPNTSCPQETSEDCLYLNVWAPLDATNISAYPVMVFIHGGSFKWGSGTDLRYDGNNLASNGKVVVVNMDYRLGLLGFLYTGDGTSDVHGNYGILDQRLALQWVQQNIGNFGGDPEKVTLFGESCGAQSTFIHMMSTDSNGLFRAAVIESNPFAIPYRNKEEALLLTDRVRQLLKCPKTDIAACMKTKSIQEILEVQEKITLKITAGKFSEYFEPVGPIVDGKVITLQPIVAAATGKYRKIPTVLGTNSDEAILFVYGALKVNLSLTEYKAVLAIIHPKKFETVEKFYAPKPDLLDYRQNLSQVITDFLFTCSNRNATRNFVKNADEQIYIYLFDHATVRPGTWGKDSFCEGHVCHAEELGYIFQNPLVQLTPDEEKLSMNMLMYWTNFAHSLDPNKGPHSPVLMWPAYMLNSTSMMHFHTPDNNLLKTYRNEYCDFWDSVGY